MANVIVINPFEVPKGNEEQALLQRKLLFEALGQESN